MLAVVDLAPAGGVGEAECPSAEERPALHERHARPAARRLAGRGDARQAAAADHDVRAGRYRRAPAVRRAMRVSFWAPDNETRPAMTS